jgi:hypothetical protein
MMDADERAVCLEKMRAASSAFYFAAVRAGNHPFIEFCGLMNEYIAACADAHNRGDDFTEFSVHAGKHLPLPSYRVDYLNEKLACIYGLNLARKVRP